MKKVLVVLGLIIGSSIAIQAQEKTPFQSFLEEVFENQLSNLSGHQDVAPFMRNFSEDLSWTDVEVEIDGTISTSVIKNKADLSKQINYLASRPSLGITWEIMEYHQLTARENTTIASLEVKVEVIANNKVIITGSNLAKVIAQKKEGKYFIKFVSLLRIDDTSVLGPCYLRLKTEDDKNYVADIAYPDGNQYEHFEKNLRFASADPLKAVIVDGVEQKFYWNPKTNDVSLDPNGRVIGNASTPETILTVIISDQTKSRCSSVIRTAQEMK